MSCYSDDGLFWFRVYGYGLVIKDVTRHRLMFSERYGYKKFIQIGKWIIRPLYKDRI